MTADEEMCEEELPVLPASTSPETEIDEVSYQALLLPSFLIGQ